MDVSLITLIVIFALFSIAIGRAFAFKFCTGMTTPVQISLLGGAFSIIAVACVYPFFGDLLKADIPLLIENPLLIGLGLLKGVGLFGGIYWAQVIREHSVSAAEYRIFIAIGILSVGNSFLGESLSIIQMFSAMALGVLGIYFCLRGHIREAPLRVQAIFFISTLVMSTYGMMDQIYLTKVSWYSYAILTAICIFVCAIIAGGKVKDLGFMMVHPSTIIAGLLWGFGDIVILATFVTYVPVTVGVASLALGVPFIMLVSAFVWKEGNWKQQAIIGILSYLAALPLILL